MIQPKEPVVMKSAAGLDAPSRTVVYAQNVVIVQPHQPTTNPTPTTSRAGMKRKIFLDAIRAGYISYVKEKAEMKKQKTHATR